MLTVIAIPEFDAATAAWIATIRAAHDPLQDRVAPHVTLAFPSMIADEESFRRRLEGVAAATAAFGAAFDRLDRMEDPHRPKYRYLNVLMADAASGARLERLHHALTGSTEAYAPHLTISRFGAVYSAKALERQIGDLGAPVLGCLGTLELLRVESGAIKAETRYPLGG